MNTKIKALQKNKKKSSLNYNLTDLKGQYDVIRNDLLKLRDDLGKGYDMAKGMMDKKVLVKEFLNTKK